MKKIFIINGGQHFAHSGGAFNKTLTEWTQDFFILLGAEVRVTDINTDFVPMDEVENFKWADVVIYNTPIWWFSLVFCLNAL